MRKWALAVVMSVNTHGYALDPQPVTGNCQPGTLVYFRHRHRNGKRNQNENQVQDPRPWPVSTVLSFMTNAVGSTRVYMCEGS